MQTTEVTDMYEAAYLLLSGCRLEAVSCIPVAASVSCTMTFSGEAIEKLQEEVYAKKACVNLHAFRLAYNTVNSHVHQAKKSYEQQQREARRAASL